MLYKEFTSALIMSAIIAAFAVPLTQLSGESQLVPFLLLACMGVFNVGQYILAVAKIDVKLSLQGYPLRRVGALFALTALYLFLLEYAGFYLDSLVYFIIASLVAQPMRITPALVIKRILVCFACIAFLYCLFTVLLAVQIPKGFLGI